MIDTLPPGPSLTPEEQTFAWYARPFSFLNECREKYGDSFTLEFKGLGKHVFYCQPEAIQQILNGDPKQYYAGEGNAIIRPFLGRNSLLILDGEGHTRHRKLLSPAFHGQQMKCFFHMMKAALHQTASRFEVGMKLTIHTVMLDISLEIILLSVFGSTKSPRIQQMKSLLVPLLDSAGFSTLVSTPETIQQGQSNAWEQFQDRARELDLLLFAEFEERRRNFEKLDKDSDILTMLMSPSQGTEAPLSTEELRDEIITLLLAGHETTATALSWAFYWIHNTPGVLDKIHAELDLAESNLGSDALNRLPYLDAVIKETLRIYPVIPVISRQLQSPAKILNSDIPAGVQVTPCIYLVHHRQDLYPNPDQFRPERFLERRFGPHEYLPFGGGVRRCIGMAFGLTEMKVVLAGILKNFSLELVQKSPIQPVRRTVTISPSGGVKMKVIAHRSNSTYN